jgi:adenosylcobinamide-GDP ribazoletransferase
MRSALGFLTPFGPAVTPGPHTLRWFPAVGAGIGAAVGAAWWASTKAWGPTLIPAALAVTVDLAATGMLHVDGLADSADGLLPHLSRDRRLQVMSQPDVGAFGLAATGAVLLLRFAAFQAQPPGIALVAAIWCLSRTLMVAATLWMPYVRQAGLASAFLGDAWAATAAVVAAGAVAAGALAFWGRGPAGIVGIAIGTLAGGSVLVLAQRRLGGFTGDVLGAVAVSAETAALVVTAARW